MMGKIMNSKLKKILVLTLLIAIVSSSIAAISATGDMEILGGSFSTDGGLEDKTYAVIYVGEEHAGADVIIQIFYSRDGNLLNHGNMVPATIKSNGAVRIASADAYAYFPDHAEINLYDSDENLLDTQSVSLSPSSGLQTFGDYEDSSYSSSSYSDSSNGGGSTTSYNSGTSNSYVGNLNSGKVHAPGCGDVNKMNPSNKVYFSSRDEAVSSGYSPCGHCHP